MADAADSNNPPPYKPPFGGTWVPAADIEALLADPTLHLEDKKFLRNMWDFSQPLAAEGLPNQQIAHQWHLLTGISDDLAYEPPINNDDLKGMIITANKKGTEKDNEISEEKQSHLSQDQLRAYNLGKLARVENTAKSRAKPREKPSKRPTPEQIVNREDDPGTRGSSRRR